MKNRKLALFTFEFPYGNQETFLENELSYLDRSFDRIDIVPLFGHSTKRELKEQNVQVQPPVFESKSSSRLLPLRSIMFWVYFFKAIAEVGVSRSKVIKALKQSIIICGLKKYLKRHSHLSYSDLWYFYWGTNSVNVIPFLGNCPKSIARFHRFDLYDLDIEGGETQVFRKQLFSRLKLAVLIAEDGKQYLKSHFKQLPAMIVSRLGVPDRGEGQMSQDSVLRLVTCSNIYLVKRVELLAEALTKISSFKIHWTHFGDGPDELKNKVMAQVQLFPSNVTCEFKGRRSNPEVMDYFRHNPVDVFVNVSISEGLPVSIMEALSFGIPVIATNAGGVGELVSEKNGRLLSLNLSAEQLSSVIEDFYRKNFKDSGLRDRARSSWSELVDADRNYSEFCELLSKL